MIPLFMGTSAKGAGNETNFSLVGPTTSDALVSVIYAHDDIYYAVGENNIGQKSSDGVNWTSFTIHPTQLANFRAIANSFIVDRLVAVSFEGYIVSSPDGVTWTQRLSSFNLFTAVAASEGGIFIAVSETGTNRVIYSNGGDVWSAATTPPAVQTWKSVTCAWWYPGGAQGRFCLISNTGVSAVSPDGQVWTGGGTPPSGLLSVTHSPDLSLFCAVGGGVVATSTDGLNWTTRTSPISSGLSSVCWARAPVNSFLACSAAAGPGAKLMKSADGINWSVVDHPSSSTLWMSVCPGFVVVGNPDTSSKVIMKGSLD